MLFLSISSLSLFSLSFIFIPFGCLAAFVAGDGARANALKRQMEFVILCELYPIEIYLACSCLANQMKIHTVNDCLSRAIHTFPFSYLFIIVWANLRHLDIN